MNLRGALILDPGKVARAAEERDLQLSKMSHRFFDKRLAEMAELSAELGAKNYVGGFVNLANYSDLQQAPAVCSAFSTTAAIQNPAPRPFIGANTVSVGTRFRVRAWGSITNTGGYTLTLGLAFNGVPGTGGTPICASGAGTPATGPLPFWVEFEATILQVGAASTASIIAQGLGYGMTATPATAVLIPATAPTALATTFFTTSPWNLTVNGVWGTSQAGITCYGHAVEQYN